MTLRPGPLLGVRSGQEAASLIGVQHGLLEQCGFQLRLESLQPRCRQSEVQGDGAVTGTRPAQRFEDLCGAFQGNEVCRIQVDRQSMYTRAVLYLTEDVIWEGCVLTMPTPWTDFDFCAVLGDL